MSWLEDNKESHKYNFKKLTWIKNILKIFLRYVFICQKK